MIPFTQVTIIKEIGGGEFGKVYLAQWRGSLVAIKKVPLHLTSNSISFLFPNSYYRIALYSVENNGDAFLGKPSCTGSSNT